MVFAFFGGLLAFTGFPFGAALALPVACCLAGFAAGFGLAMSAPMVTGASSCSAALGAAREFKLKNIRVLAMSKRKVFVFRAFINE